MIRDPDADAEVREIERDLLDAAAAGTLDPARQALVAARLMDEARNRGAVLLAQALAEHHARASGTAAAAAAAAAARGSSGDEPDRRFAYRADAGGKRTHPVRSMAPVWRWSIAAAALVIASGLGLFTLRTSRDTHESPVSPTAWPTAANNPTNPPANTASNAAANTPANAAANTTPGSVDPAVPPAIESPRAQASGKGVNELPRDPSRIVALVLPTGTLRGARPTVTLPREAEMLRLEIELDDAPRPMPAEVTIMVRALAPPSDGSFEWSSRVRVRAENGQPIAVALVPAQSIPAGPMEATITWPRRQSQDQAGVSPPPSRVISFLVRRN